MLMHTKASTSQGDKGSIINTLSVSPSTGVRDWDTRMLRRDQERKNKKRLTGSPMGSSLYFTTEEEGPRSAWTMLVMTDRCVLNFVRIQRSLIQRQGTGNPRKKI